MSKKALLGFIMAFCLLAATACNTFHGMGKDLESAGKTVEKSSGK